MTITWAKLTVHKKLLQDAIEEMEGGKVSRFMLGEMKKALACTVPNKRGTKCNLCGWPMRPEDTGWKKMYIHSLCTRCCNDIANYGSD